MFRTRSFSDTDELSGDVKLKMGLSTTGEDSLMEDEPEDNAESSRSFQQPDSNSSFRRSVREGTISVSEDADPVIPQNLGVSKLSFTDLLVENQLSGIQLRKGMAHRVIDKKKGKRGLDLSKITKTLPTVREQSRQIPDHTELMESQTQDPGEVEALDEDGREEVVKEMELDGKNEGEVTRKFSLSDDEMDFDIEIELSQIVDELEAELETMTNDIKTFNSLITNNAESLSNLRLEELEIERELGSHFMLFETSKNLKNLVTNKESDLLKALKTIRKNRTEECEYLLRVRRWLHCDLVRLVGGPCVDYSCGKLEDVDEMGKDISLRIEKTFNKRSKRLETILNEFKEKSVEDARKFRGRELEDYLVKEARDLFRMKMEEDYTVEELSVMYDYELNKEESESDFMDDVTEEFRSVLTPVMLFRDFKEQNKEDYELMKLEENLKKAFVFYAKLATVTWNPLENGTPEKSEWFREFVKFDRKLLNLLVDEVFYELVFDCIESFDVESERECANLAEFMKFVIKNMSTNNHSGKLEKMINALGNSLRTKVQMLSVTMDGDQAFSRASVGDSLVCALVKFCYLNLASTCMSFSDILSGLTLSCMVIDDLFVRRLAPLMDCQSRLDAFVSLNFKVVTIQLKVQMQVKTKNNEAVRSTLARFAESEWTRDSDLEAFEQLSVPISNAKYRQLVNL